MEIAVLQERHEPRGSHLEPNLWACREFLNSDVPGEVNVFEGGVSGHRFTLG
jgi:hypothetical protein